MNEEFVVTGKTEEEVIHQTTLLMYALSRPDLFEVKNGPCGPMMRLMNKGVKQQINFDY